MAKVVGLVLLLLLSGAVTAQRRNQAEKQQIMDAVGNESVTGTVQTFDERYEGVKGSPFLLEQWTPGMVFMHNGKVFDRLQVKYNLYLDEIAVKRPDGAEVVPDKNAVRSFTLDSTSTGQLRRFIRVNYLTNHHLFPPHHFVEVLYEGESMLLATHDKKLIRADYQKAYSAGRPYDMFGETMTKYYWIAPDGQVNVLKPGRKAVAKLFSDKKNSIDTFVKENAIDLKSRQGLVQVVRHYDQH